MNTAMGGHIGKHIWYGKGEKYNTYFPMFVALRNQFYAFNDCKSILGVVDNQNRK